MNRLSLLLASALILPSFGQTVYTVPQGYTKVSIAAASSPTEPTLTAISATLMNDVEHAGAVTINADFDPDPDADPATSDSIQTITATGATWAANAFTTDPHLAYLVNSDGSEESFLIVSHTADTLTVSTSFNLLADTRFPASTTLKIRKANTVGSILGTTSTPFTVNDRIYIWTGSSWQTLIAVGGNWVYLGGPNNNQSATGAVIFPEEGIFVQRAETTAAELTLFGEVPSVAQASTVPGGSSVFVSTRFPVGSSPVANPTGIRLADLNIDEIPGWDSTDRAYFWTGSSWQTLISIGANWIYLGGPLNNTPANDLLVPPNSALFLTRATAGSESASPFTVDPPYTVE